MAFSRATASEAVSRFGIALGQIVVDRPGIDLSRFMPARDDATATADRGRLRLAFVGHNFALKGLQIAITALGSLRRTGVDAVLTVAGAGRASRYESVAEGFGVADAVRFVGPLAPDGVADLYRSSDLLVHPTFYDPFPRVVIEALACGCPVITTARCGASEVLAHGANGFIVDDPSDAEAIARFACELTDPVRLSGMRQAAVRTGRGFDSARHFDRVIDWLDSSSPASTT